MVQRSLDTVFNEETKVTPETSLEAIIDSYISFYASGGGHTAKAKRLDLINFLQFLANGRQPEEVKLRDWTHQSTSSYIEKRLSQGSAPATVSRRLATLKHFGRTMAERIPGFVNPARETKGPKIQLLKPKSLSEEEISSLVSLNEAFLRKKNNTFIYQRNYFLFEFFIATGLRADEIRTLVIGQLEGDLNWLKNVKTKGKQFRNVYVESEIREKFSSYLELRRTEILKKFPLFSKLTQAEQAQFPVFISLNSANISKPETFALSPKTLWRVISDFGKMLQKNEVTKKSQSIHPHLLRHTFAHGLLESSKDIRLVAQALGHGDIRTTMRYTERSAEEVAKAIEEKKFANRK